MNKVEQPRLTASDSLSHQLPVIVASEAQCAAMKLVASTFEVIKTENTENEGTMMSLDSARHYNTTIKSSPAGLRGKPTISSSVSINLTQKRILKASKRQDSPPAVSSAPHPCYLCGLNDATCTTFGDLHMSSRRSTRRYHDRDVSRDKILMEILERKEANEEGEKLRQRDIGDNDSDKDNEPPQSDERMAALSFGGRYYTKEVGTERKMNHLANAAA